MVLTSSHLAPRISSILTELDCSLEEIVTDNLTTEGSSGHDIVMLSPDEILRRTSPFEPRPCKPEEQMPMDIPTRETLSTTAIRDRGLELLRRKGGARYQIENYSGTAPRVRFSDHRTERDR
jgi:hypothetical protein